MIRTEKMSHVVMIAPKTAKKDIISKLYELGVYHIDPYKKSDWQQGTKQTEQQDVDRGRPLQEGEQLASAIVKLRALLTTLDIQRDHNEQELNSIKIDNATIKKEHKISRGDFSELIKKLDQMYTKVLNLLEDKKEKREQIREAGEKIKLITIVKHLHLTKDLLRESQYLEHYIGSLEEGEACKRELAGISSRIACMITKSDEPGRDLAVVYFEKKSNKQQEIAEVLNKHGFNEIDLKQILDETGKGKPQHIDQFIHTLHNKMSTLTRQLHQTQMELNTIKREHSRFLLKFEELLEKETAKAEVPLQFGETQRSMIMSGWIPTQKMERVKHDLNAITDHKIHIQDQEDGKNAPIKFTNPAIVKPYEFFLHLYELPNYKELDPTWLMFITFPLFFGIMLGDVGYGLVTLTLFSILRLKMPQFKALLNIMIFSSLITILFGFGFGEYFGFEHVSAETGEVWCEKIGLCLPVHEVEMRGAGGGAEIERIADFPRLLNRAHGYVDVGGMRLLSVLVMAFLIGVVHLNLALFIGFINIWKNHSLAHALLEKASWMIIQLGAVLLVLGYGKIPLLGYGIYPLTGYIVLTAGIIMLYKGEGVQGLVELPAIFSNMLSYMRLGAVGLASVGLAVVVNEKLTLPYLEKGGWFVVLGIFVLVVGHVINIALGVIGPFLHSLRLHYVEFFSKFYKGGGVLYSPFGQKQRE